MRSTARMRSTWPGGVDMLTNSACWSWRCRRQYPNLDLSPLKGDRRDCGDIGPFGHRDRRRKPSSAKELAEQLAPWARRPTTGRRRPGIVATTSDGPRHPTARTNGPARQGHPRCVRRIPPRRPSGGSPPEVTCRRPGSRRRLRRAEPRRRPLAAGRQRPHIALVAQQKLLVEPFFLLPRQQ